MDIFENLFCFVELYIKIRIDKKFRHFKKYIKGKVRIKNIRKKLSYIPITYMQ